MTAISEQTKALRGTKRACHECAVRFYDLARDPIVCPACGTQHTPEPPLPVFEPGKTGTRFAAKSSWRSRGAKNPEPHPLPADPEPAGAPEMETAALEEEEGAEAPTTEAVPMDDDVVLEQEVDDGDISGLVEDIEEPKDQ
jgi:uncharacterized protein (TIGR02300 family)